MDEEIDEVRERIKDKLLEEARRGSARSSPVEVSDADVEAFVGRHDVAVVDVWAEWCGPCRRLAPMIEDLAQDLAGRVAFGKLDADDNPATVRSHGIEAIPTLLVYKEGRLVDRITGVPAKAKLRERVLAHVE